MAWLHTTYGASTVEQQSDAQLDQVLQLGRVSSIASVLSDDSDIEQNDQEAQLLQQLQELHRQLADVRQQAKINQPFGGRIVQERHKLIICSCRKPVRITRSEDGDAWNYDASQGGFKSAIDHLMGRNRVHWISWTGAVIDNGSKAGVRKRLETEFNCTPVFFSKELEDLAYHQFCQGTLWPLFHCIPTNFNKGLLDNFLGQYEAYDHANKLFLDAVAEVYEEGDLVLVYDYELMLLPALLRKRFPEITCGFFLHCPFPSTEFYRMLPVRQVLLQGILGADLVSFNHFDYVRHFLNSCTRILGLESYPSRIEYNGRLISASICPMGINPEDFAITPEIRKYMDHLQAAHRTKDHKVIVSIERLDLCKGIPLKLLAMESLLQNQPDWRGRVHMFMVVRDWGCKGDHHLRKAVDSLVGRVNGRFGYADYCPVHYVKQRLSHKEIVALYAIADVSLITSLREGVNLCAMEFIACQQEQRHGVLIYSEFAGCATSFKGAMLVNPYDPDKVAESIHTALTMPDMTKKIRHHQLSRYVNHYTSHLWARRVVSALQQAGQKAKEYNRLQRLDIGYLKNFYSRCRRRLLALDYDGTLVPHHSLRQLARPPANVISVLEGLCDDPANVVYIISGRRKEDLQEWLGHISKLGMIAEHGYWVKPAYAHRAGASSDRDEVMSLVSDIGGGLEHSVMEEVTPRSRFFSNSSGMHESCRPQRLNTYTRTVSHQPSFRMQPFLSHPGSTYSGMDLLQEPEPWLSEWQCRELSVDLSWRADVLAILQNFTDRTPGSFLELKDSGLTWHFRDADPDFGLTQAKNLQLHFDQMLQNAQVRVVMAPIKKYIVIQPARINKGKALSTILHEDLQVFDLILGMGDERTDEDMFDVLQGSQCFTCTVGKKISKAQYYLEDSDAVVATLLALVRVSEHSLAATKEKREDMFTARHTPRPVLPSTPSGLAMLSGGGTSRQSISSPKSSPLLSSGDERPEQP